MTAHRLPTRYSKWDGTQQIESVSADDVMSAIADQLMDDGDLMRALRQLFRDGIDLPDGERLPGWREMMQRVRQRRQEQLNRFDLGSIFDDITNRLREVIETEREGIEERLEAANQRVDAAQDAASRIGREESREAGESNDVGAHGRAPASAGAEAASDDATTSGGDEPDLEEERRLLQMLEGMADRKRDQLADLPTDPAGAIKALQQYDFMSPAARQKFADLLEMLQQQVLQQSFQGMREALGDMGPENVAEMRQMMSELNDMLEARPAARTRTSTTSCTGGGTSSGRTCKSIDDLMEHMASRCRP
jgi:uncharacterized protein with von Willebrand factor type A (vWA) domain